MDSERKTVARCYCCDSDSSGGCVEDEGPTDNQSTAQSTDEAVVEPFFTDPDRPECEKKFEIIDAEQAGEPDKYETAATVPYPPESESSGKETIASFVKKFDNASLRHDILCRGRSGEILNLSHSVKEKVTLDWQDEITHFSIFAQQGLPQGPMTAERCGRQTLETSVSCMLLMKRGLQEQSLRMQL